MGGGEFQGELSYQLESKASNHAQKGQLGDDFKKMEGGKSSQKLRTQKAVGESSLGLENESLNLQSMQKSADSDI